MSKSETGSDEIEPDVSEADSSRVVWQRSLLSRTAERARARPLLATLAVGMLVAGISLAWYTGWLRALMTWDAPVWIQNAIWYGSLGALIGALPAYLIVRHFHKPTGLHALDLDPVGRRHRHLRLGEEVLEELTVRTAWGENVSMDALKEISVNGEQGIEMMDFRVTEENGPVCVATWMGEADSSRLRAYSRAVIYARRRLTRRAERALTLDANREALVREAAERVVYRMIRTSEAGSMPGGEEIEGVVEDVLSDFGIERDALAEPLSEERNGGRESVESEPGVEAEKEIKDALSRMGEDDAVEWGKVRD